MNVLLQITVKFRIHDLLVLCIISLNVIWSVYCLPDSQDIMSTRQDRVERGNEEGPARKKSRMEQSSSSYQFPTTLEDFQYQFNDKGQLRHSVTGKPYEFEFKKGDPTYNQRRYEALGKIITQHIYKLLETETKLERIYIPTDHQDNEPRSFVFVSKNALTTRGKLLVLINGSGAVRAGQWARKLIINDCLDSGTQLPYIKKALEEGYEVLVMNTNENRGPDSSGRSVPIRKSSSPYEHGVYVWDKFIASRPVRHVAIVAHSMGGSVTEHIASKREQSFLKKVFAVAFTDSVHSMATLGISHNIKKFFAKHTVNWVSSVQPLDTPRPSKRPLDSKQVSAGTQVHAETSWTSFKSVFKFLKRKETELMTKERGQTGHNPGVSIAHDEDLDDDDDDSTLELRKESSDDESQDKEIGQGDQPKGRSGAGIDISSSDEDTEASFDFQRYSEEL
ncbi:cotranscriptional regulator ARB2A homolog [Lytechinus pictus]|uniref:cotranscriptional regulator ARB2A homolog n=1 Tax=Lytechinus pictus TaxID=7653 RepID=UPI0030B9DE53